MIFSNILLHAILFANRQEKRNFFPHSIIEFEGIYNDEKPVHWRTGDPENYEMTH